MTKTIKRGWTAGEDKILMRFAFAPRTTLIDKLPDRTPAAISQRLQVLGRPPGESECTRLARIVAKQWGVTLAGVRGRMRDRPHSDARQVLMHLLHTICNYNATQVGGILGRDHTTVLHGLAMVEGQRAVDAGFAAKVARCEEQAVSQ